MDWLTRLPWIGPWIARGMRTHAWRAFDHLQRAQWTRLAAAITFTSFVALFPLLTVGAAIGAAVLSPAELHTLEHRLAQQVPGLSQRLDIAGLQANAGTVGLIGGVLLFLTGAGWVAQTRGCLRAVWGLEPDQDNPVRRRLVDGAILLGLGATGLASVLCSTFATTAVGWAARHLGVASGGAGDVLLTVASYVFAVLADVLLLAYLLTWLPGVTPPRRSVAVAGLMGAAGFELLKALLGGYLQGVAGRTMYGAFGTPVALLLWFNFMARLLLFCAAWTATGHDDRGAPAPGGAAVTSCPAVPAARAVRATPASPGEPAESLVREASGTPATSGPPGRAAAARPAAATSAARPSPPRPGRPAGRR